ncbi:amidohydrolase [Tomitella cavernea]|uniref:Peptidase M20 domain-containing protein 2 n=1 Tax=Tomitella cavernea TaxID=1387982 RepID=A0ABP9C4T3_9ACTN
MVPVKSTEDPAALKARARARIDAARGRLIALSRDIHAAPELAFDEYHAAQRASELLEAEGFAIERGAGGLDTAFVATYGDGDLTIGLCAEYDALPGLGHACGHNIIAAASVGAALGLADVADEAGVRVVVIGTPAEEQGGGKIRLLERGVFDAVTVAMMVHPEAFEVHPADVATPAVARFAVTYTGRSAHASAAPHEAVNAADAAVVAQVAVGLLRQQLTADCRIGLYVREGGEATNIIPAHTVVECEVRAAATDTLDELRRRVIACFEAGSLATGAQVAIEQTQPPYAALEPDPMLSHYYAANAAVLGRAPAARGTRTVGSTDMGDITRALPGIHPMIAIRGAGSHPHTAGFADDAVSPAADDTAVDGALALAFTGIDVALDAAARARYIDRHRARAGRA